MEIAVEPSIDYTLNYEVTVSMFHLLYSRVQFVDVRYIAPDASRYSDNDIVRYEVEFKH